MEQLREAIHRNPAVVIVAVVILIASLWWHVLEPITGNGARRAFYFDLETSRLFTQRTGLLAPIKAPSGGDGVLAIVMSCGSCDDASQRYIGWIEKYSDAFKQNEAAQRHRDPDLMRRHWFIRTLQSDEWVLAAGAQAQVIRRTAERHCGRREARVCQPR